MADETKQGAIGDAGDPRAMETDPNGARTAVGVPHPGNRAEGQRLPVVDVSGIELDDYDDDKQGPTPVSELPPDQDAGDSFPEIIDVGETSEEHDGRTDRYTVAPPNPPAKPLVDNQVNQPERFHNRQSGDTVR